MEAIGGWLLLYLVGSIPVSLFHAAGLAGRFFDYHLGVLAGTFLLLATPLALLVSKSTSAPAWNIAALWVGAASTSLIVIHGAVHADRARLNEAAMTMVLIVLASVSWSAIWTGYFLRSERVARTFL